MARYRPTAVEWVGVSLTLLLATVLAWGAADYALGFLENRARPEYQNPWVGLVTAAFATFFYVVVIAWWRSRNRRAHEHAAGPAG